MIIYSCFVLIDLINNYKNIYSRNICMMVFCKNCLYNGVYENCLHNDFSYELLVCGDFFMHIVAFLVLKRVMCMFEISVIFAGMLFNMIINVIIF